MIKAIIVDDELDARENLIYLTQNFCTNIQIITTCSNVDEAVVVIKEKKPDVVFLDIEMPQKNGFQLLKEFEDVFFKIVFVTAYDQYAIKAFEVSALDYLLKPIDVDRLKDVEIKIQEVFNKTSYQERLDTLSQNKKAITKIAIPYKNDYAVLNIEDVFCIEADRMYTHIYTQKNKKYMASKNLSYYEDLLKGHQKIIRVHRSWMINLNHVESYSKTENHIILNNKVKVPVSKTYRGVVKDKLGL